MMKITNVFWKALIKTLGLAAGLAGLMYFVFLYPATGKTTITLELMLSRPQEIRLSYDNDGVPEAVAVTQSYAYSGKYIGLTFELPTNKVSAVSFDFGKLDGFLLIRSASIQNGKMHFYDLKSDLLNFDRQGLASPVWDGSSISWTVLGPQAKLSHKIEIMQYWFIVPAIFGVFVFGLFGLMYQLERRGIRYMTVGFGILIFLPLAFLGSTPPLFQNRAMNELPLLQNGAKPKHIGEPIEGWFADHMGFKSEITKLYRNSLWFNASVANNKSVLRGQNGWLFITDENSIGDFTHQNYFTESELQKITADLVMIKENLAKRGIRFLLMLAPDKHSVYPEFYNSRYFQLSSPSRTDKLVDYLNSHGLSDNVIFVRDYLKSKKAEHPLYLKTDTHWNSYGAFYGAQTLVSKLKEYYPSIRIPELNRFQFIKSEGLIGTDLNLMSGTEPIPEENFYFSPKQGTIRSQQSAQNEILDDAAATHDPYYEGSWGSHENSDFFSVTTKNNANPKAIVFHDSFMIWMFNFMIPSFSTAEYIYRPLKIHNLDEIYKAKPDIVIFEVLERVFTLNLLSIDSLQYK